MSGYESEKETGSEIRRRAQHLLDNSADEPAEVTIRLLHDLLMAQSSLDMLDQDSHRLLRIAGGIVQVIPTPLVALDPTLRVVWANRAYHETFNPQAELIANLPFETIADGQWAHPPVLDLLRATLSEGALSRSIEVNLPYGFSEARSLRVTAHRMVADAHSTDCVLVTLEDVTQRRDAELARRHLASLVDAAAEAIFRKDLDGVITTWNRGAELIYGYTPDEAIGHHISLIVPPDKLGELDSTMESVRNAESVYQMETVRRRKDGRLIDVSLTISPIRDETGMVIAAASIGRDITEQKRHLAERAFLATIVEASSDAILGVTVDGYIQSWNRGAEAMYGYAPSEMVGRRLSLLVPEDRRSEFDDILQKVRQGHRIEQLETVRRRRNGTLLHVSLTISPLLDRSGEIVAFSAIARDITQKHRYQTELETVNRDLQRRTHDLEIANRELEAFSYSVSHDLRAPLRSIDGFSRAIDEDFGDRLDETGRDYLRRIHDGAEHMRHLIEALLRLSRVSRVDLHWMTVDLSDLAHRVVARSRLQNPDRTIECSIEESIAGAGDPQLLEVVLDNLLGNAFKFTAERRTAQVAFGTVSREGEQVYFVRDNGAGFDSTYADRLFLYFQRLHHPDRFPGLGIGLPLVKRIIERHNGRVWAEGTVDKGAIFYFTLGPMPERTEPA